MKFNCWYGQVLYFASVSSLPTTTQNTLKLVTLTSKPSLTNNPTLSRLVLSK